MKDVLDLFYLGFLRLDEGDVEVVELVDSQLVALFRNPCPILRLSIMLKIETKVACRIVSGPVCKYVLASLTLVWPLRETIST
jgi:hypothetical protein